MSFINNSVFRPEVFLSVLPFWDWQLYNYPIIMILWNLFLAVIPIFLAWLLIQQLQAAKKNWYLISFLALVWLGMVPNTAYLITETRHSLGDCLTETYNNVCPATAWTPIFFFVFALSGWLSLIWAIRPLENVLRKIYGAHIGNLFIGLTLPLLALGVLLGLVNRFNSWELLTEPLKIIIIACSYFFNLTLLKNYFIITILLLILYLVGSRVIRRLPWEINK